MKKETIIKIARTAAHGKCSFELTHQGDDAVLTIAHYNAFMTARNKKGSVVWHMLYVQRDDKHITDLAAVIGANFDGALTLRAVETSEGEVLKAATCFRLDMRPLA